MNKEYFWYAVYTRSRAEKKVARELEFMGVEFYLPIIRKYRKWSDRVKAVDMPLISSYIFVKVSNIEYYNVLNIRDIVCYITFEGKAVSIPEKQINNLRLLCGSKNADGIHVEALDFEKGEVVKINQGDFKGFEGEIVHSKGASKLVIRLEHLNCSIVLEVSSFMVDKTNK